MGNKNKGTSTSGSPITINEAPKNLARRLRGYELMAKTRSFNPDAFHRPGSLKK